MTAEYEAASPMGKLEMEAAYEDSQREQAELLKDLQDSQGPDDALGILRV